MHHGHPSARTGEVAVNGTRLFAQRRGSGRPVLLVHGAGEDSAVLSGLAGCLASEGFDVVTYDRRGTGRSGRDDWPGDGARQHAADAAALVQALGIGPMHVVGVSSGAVVALTLAQRFPRAIRYAVSWEAPAVAVVPGGLDMHAELMAPVHAHLAAHPGDYAGAQVVLYAQMAQAPPDPGLVPPHERANAEPCVRDDPLIVTAELGPELARRRVVVAVGERPNPVVAAAADRLARLAGQPVVRGPGEHTGFVQQPEPLAAWLAALLLTREPPTREPPTREPPTR